MCVFNHRYKIKKKIKKIKNITIKSAKKYQEE